MACISIPTAMLIGTAVAGVGGIASALIGANASQTAAAQQVSAANTAIKSTTDIYNANKALLSPYVLEGSGVGVAGVNALLGGGTLNPTAMNAALAATPGYKFALDQGLKSVQNSYAAKGLGGSGAAVRGGIDYAEGLAGTQFQNIFGNYLDVARLGEAAGGAIAGVGTNVGGNISNLITGAGSSQAAGTVGAANALTGGLNSFLGSAGNSAMMLGLYNSGFFGGAGLTASGSNALIPNAWSQSRGFYAT